MKTADTHTTTTPARAQQQADSQPFFQPEKEQGFFGGKTETAEPFFSPSTIQTKPASSAGRLKIGAPNDKYEQEADSMADQVVQRLAQDQSAAPAVDNKTAATTETQPALQRSISPATTITPTLLQRQANPEQKVEPEVEQEEILQLKPIFDSPGIGDEQVQRKCTSCAAQKKGIVQRMGTTPEEETPDLQTKCAACEAEEGIQPKRIPAIQRSGDGSLQVSDDFSSRLQASKGGGSPMSSNTRSTMEGAMGADFSGVRVHTGSEADSLSDDIGAQAFTHGSDVYFNEGKYDPGSSSGQHLLAHELTHTVQQGGSSKNIQRKIDPDNPPQKIQNKKSILIVQSIFNTPLSGEWDQETLETFSGKKWAETEESFIRFVFGKFTEVYSTDLLTDMESLLNKMLEKIDEWDQLYASLIADSDLMSPTDLETKLKTQIASIFNLEDKKWEKLKEGWVALPGENQQLGKSLEERILKLKELGKEYDAYQVTKSGGMFNYKNSSYTDAHLLLTDYIAPVEFKEGDRKGRIKKYREQYKGNIEKYKDKQTDIRKSNLTTAKQNYMKVQNSAIKFSQTYLDLHLKSFIESARYRVETELKILLQKEKESQQKVNFSSEAEMQPASDTSKLIQLTTDYLNIDLAAKGILSLQYDARLDSLSFSQPKGKISKIKEAIEETPKSVIPIFAKGSFVGIVFFETGNLKTVKLKDNAFQDFEMLKETLLEADSIKPKNWKVNDLKKKKTPLYLPEKGDKHYQVQSEKIQLAKEENNKYWKDPKSISIIQNIVDAPQANSFSDQSIQYISQWKKKNRLTVKKKNAFRWGVFSLEELKIAFDLLIQSKSFNAALQLILDFYNFLDYLPAINEAGAMLPEGEKQIGNNKDQGGMSYEYILNMYYKKDALEKNNKESAATGSDNQISKLSMVLIGEEAMDDFSETVATLAHELVHVRQNELGTPDGLREIYAETMELTDKFGAIDLPKRDINTYAGSYLRSIREYLELDIDVSEKNRSLINNVTALFVEKHKAEFGRAGIVPLKTDNTSIGSTSTIQVSGDPNYEKHHRSQQMVENRKIGTAVLKILDSIYSFTKDPTINKFKATEGEIIKYFKDENWKVTGELASSYEKALQEEFSEIRSQLYSFTLKKMLEQATQLNIPDVPGYIPTFKTNVNFEQYVIKPSEEK